MRRNPLILALTAAALNLVNELFGKEQMAGGNVDGGVAVGGRALRL